MVVLHIPKSEVTRTSSQHTYQPCLVPQEVYMSTSTFEIHQVPIYFDFTHMQIWANTQSYDDPGRISFNVDSSKQWSPLFKEGTAALASHQVQYAE